MSVLTEHAMPSGARIFYREDPYHQYFADAKRNKDGSLSGVGRLVGVSTIARVYDTGSSDGLLQWAVNLDRAGIAEMVTQDLAAGMDLDWLRRPQSIAEALEAGEATWKHVRDRAGTRGTNVHEHALQALAEGGRVNYAEMTDEEVGYAQGVAAFWLDAEPEPIVAEQVVGHAGIGAAGRLDLLARIDGVLTIVDAKTGKYVGADGAVQQAGYRMLAALAGFPEPERMMLLKVTADGGYVPVYVEAEERDFLTALEAYRRSKVIGKQVREAVKAYA